MVVTNSCGSLPAECLPSRKHTSGATPGITTEEVLGPLRRDPHKSKFNPPVRSPTSEEAVEMFRLMIERGILTIMSNHTYLWNDTLKLQQDGGPIGDKFSQAAARLYLIWWDRQFLHLVKVAGINITLYKRFVDDANCKAVALEQGIAWCQ